MITFGIVGLLLISYGLWVKNEKVQDIVYMAGGGFLLVYSAYIGDPVFIVLQIIFILSALIEYVKIRKQ